MLQQQIREHCKPLSAILLFWSLYLVPLFWRTFQIRPEGIYVGIGHMWSDWPLHIGIARIFATKPPSEWLTYHPLYADGRFTYTFLNDAISGFLLRAGLDLHSAFFIPAAIESLLLCIGLYVFLYLVLRSRLEALLGTALFFCSSGLGLFRMVDELLKTGDWSLLFGAKEFTSYPGYAWYSGNILDGFLLPQRSFLLGMPVVLWSMIGVLWVVQNPKIQRRASRIILLICGILAGLLPIIHAHSLIVEMILMGLVVLCSRQKWKDLFVFFVLPAAILAPLVLLLIRHREMGRSFFVWYPGWNAKGFVDWLQMWSLIFGAAVPLAIAGLALKWKILSTQARMIFIGIFVTFAFTNLVLTQPGPWDNSKIFMWVYLGFSGLAAVTLHRLWNLKFYGRIASVVLMLVTCGAGLITLIYLQRVDLHPYGILRTEDQKLAEQIHANTGPFDRFLTAAATDSPIMSWAARPILMGFYAWVENYGFNPKDLYRDELDIFAGTAQTAALIAKHRVSYVVIGPAELDSMKANESYFQQNYPLAFSNENFRVYDTRKDLEPKRH